MMRSYVERFFYDKNNWDVLVSRTSQHKKEFNGLDEESESKIFDLLLEINRNEGTTIVIVSHDREELERLCHKIYRIQSREIKCVYSRNLCVNAP